MWFSPSMGQALLQLYAHGDVNDQLVINYNGSHQLMDYGHSR